MGSDSQTLDIGTSYFTMSANDANCIAENQMKYELFTNDGLTTRLTDFTFMYFVDGAN